MKFPIFFDGDIAVQEIADALASRGIHLLTDVNGRMTAHTVPRFIRREAPASNVVPMQRKPKGVTK